jgi:formylglycine-generating enzyme required for sulfatase activity
VDRAQAGDALDTLGDPRFHGQGRWWLPKDDILGFIDIPAGACTMGSAPNDGFDAERPQHEVSLLRYFIARYPVTVAQFRAFIDDTGYVWRARDYQQGQGNHPVKEVSWYDAMAYCEWLSGKL